jgi:hypothetical protein
MIRFDTFRFDYDTKNVIVFSHAVVVGSSRLATNNVLQIWPVAAHLQFVF